MTKLDQRISTVTKEAKAMIKQGYSKADTARYIFKELSDQPRKVILQVFRDGAGLTERGSATYYQNIKNED